MKKIYFTILSAFLFTLGVNAQAVELNASQIDFGTLTYGESDSVLVEINNLLDEEIAVEAPEFFDVYESSPFYVNNYPTTIAASGAASFYVVFKPIHNIVHNSEMVLKTGGNRGAVSLDLIGDCVYPGVYYSLTHNLIDENLETAFHTLLAQNYQDYGYSGARDRMFMEIDNKKVNGQGASQNTIERVYIGTEAVGYTSRQDAQSNYNLNTEHTVPQSTFNENLPMRADMHHLFITDNPANGIRGNLDFGNVVSGIDWSEGGSKRGQQANGQTVFEPRDAQKGPTARAVLYFIVRYQNYDGFLTETQEQTLRAWSQEFPPEQIEKNRNEHIFNFQHNRNPFVDYPQFLDRIYNIRLEENRPNVGLLTVSTQDVAFEAVAQSTTETYNVVLTNYGERFLLVSDLSFEDNQTSSFDFGETLPTNIAINPGESYSIPITCFTTSSGDDLDATLHFTSTALGSDDVNIPVSASVETGLANIDHTVDFKIVPNPAVANVKLVNLQAPISFIQVYDITGRLCLEQSGDKKIFSTTQLKSGLYQIVVQMQDGKMATRKLVKQ